MEAGLTRNMDLGWPLALGLELLLAGLRRPEGAVKVESVSESLVSLVIEVCGGSGLLDWLLADLACQEAGVSDVPASSTAALSLQKGRALFTEARATCSSSRIVSRWMQTQ